MKQILIALIAVGLLANVSTAQDKSETAWFDMAGCDICKNMQPLMMHMSKMKWDSKPTKNGLITITVVPDDLQATWKQCKSSMESVIKEMEGGAEKKCCGFCQSFGSLIQAGAEKEEIKTAAGEIMLLTSTNPDVVKKIHAHVKKTAAENEKMKKMMQQMQQQQKGE